MVIGMYGTLGAELSTKHLNGAVSNHFINVHVGLCAGAGLPYHQREMIIQLTRNHLQRSNNMTVWCGSSSSSSVEA